MDPIFANVDPLLIEKINRVLAAMAILGHPMKVYQGYRTTDQQAALFKQGRSLPGPNPSHERPLGQTVTDCDGVVHKSCHQSGRAVDCCALGAEAFPATFPWPLYAMCVRAVGLKAGADFLKKDLDHAELL